MYQENQSSDWHTARKIVHRLTDTRRFGSENPSDCALWCFLLCSSTLWKSLLNDSEQNGHDTEWAKKGNESRHIGELLYHIYIKINIPTYWWLEQIQMEKVFLLVQLLSGWWCCSPNNHKEEERKMDRQIGRRISTLADPEDNSQRMNPPLRIQ